LLSAVQNSVVVFKISGNADQNAGPHDPSLSWRAPVRSRCENLAGSTDAEERKHLIGRNRLGGYAHAKAAASEADIRATEFRRRSARANS
jgi:hypothetical protein